MTTFVVPAAVSTLVAGETGHHPTPAGAKPRRQLARIWLRVASLGANPAIPIRRPKIAESDRGMVLLNEVRTKGLGSSSSNGDAVQTQKAALFFRGRRASSMDSRTFDLISSPSASWAKASSSWIASFSKFLDSSKNVAFTVIVECGRLQPFRHSALRAYGILWSRLA
jgi:hypothetical protein